MNRGEKKTCQKDNPLEKANIFSKFTYWWMKDIFRLGIKGPIPPDEIYKPMSTLESKRITGRFIQMWSEELKRKSPSLLRVILRIYGVSLIFWALSFSLLQSALRVLQPLCLGGLVSYFAPDQNDISKSDAYWYAGGIVLSSVINVFTFHPYTLYTCVLGAKIRLGCSGLVYRKTLNLSKAAVYDGINGKVINLLSNDVSRLEPAILFFYSVWKGPLEALLFGYFIYQQIGVAGVIGIAFLLSFIPIQAQLRLRTAKRTDIRVKIMNEIILGIQVIKMYAWEKSFAIMVDKIRKKEVNAIRGTAYLKATLFSIRIISRLSIFVSLLTYIFLGNVITAQKVFIVFSLFNILNYSMVYYWPMALTNVAEGYVSVKRIQEFLLASERKPKALEHKKIDNDTDDVTEDKLSKKSLLENGVSRMPLSTLTSKRIVDLNAKFKGIVMRNLTAMWEKGDKKNSGIYDFNLIVPDGQLCAVVGPIGAGKSTLLHVIIGELDVDDGDCVINGSISYASQEAWLFEGSVRSNIIFIEEFDPKRYKEVVRVCGLERDFKLMPNGDMTIVGERGISLSGGQKARVSLARAVYKQADIYLLDDPLSAVDSHVGKHMFQECIQKFLANKVCILVTHQLQYLKDVNHLVLMYHGRIESQGTYAEVQQSYAESFLTIRALDETGNEELEAERKRTSSTTSLVSVGVVDKINKIDDREELQAVGGVQLGVHKSYFKAVESGAYIIFIAVFFSGGIGLLSGVDLYISQWTNWEGQTAATNSSTNGTEVGDVVFDNKTRNDYISTYAILMAVATYVYVHRTFAFFSMCMRASINLHEKLFRSVTRATMQFYNNNPSGRILNRFSRDINSIDTKLPPALMDCISFFLEFFAIMVIVAIANYWLLIPTFVMSIFFYILRYIYISSARSIKRVESLTQSPIYSHVNATLQGLSTVRAFHAQQALESEFYVHSDYNTGSFHLQIAATRAFAFWLDVVCLLFIACVTFSFVIIDDQSARSGNVGLAILHCINLIGMCQWGMRQTAEVENQMTSVERVMEYAELPSEAALESEPKFRPPDNWPSNGEIIFNDLNFKYSENSNFVLKHLNLRIQPREKIGIVGRTGAGKSSMVQAMFRLAELNGEILIDGIAINTLGLHDLRKKISIIPQDPVLFSGTLRFNLDPFDEHNDEKLWDALEKVELKSFVSALPNGLDYKMMDGGSNYSVGQRQLVCLAHAVLRNNKILICDEATANVDPETDKLIQTTIREKFSDCSVLTIAHRLHTVMDNDRILVIDAGSAVEFGHPHELLQRSDGHLRQLVDQTGAAASEVLMIIAAESFSKK